jgi:hypothetical protein
MYEGRMWLVTEGIWREFNGGDFEYYAGSWQTVSVGNRTLQMSHIERWVMSAVILGGLSYWHCPLRTDTARFVSNLNHFWCADEYEKHRTYDVIYRKPPDRVAFTEPSDFVKMVSVADKVGWSKAMEIEKHFGGDFDALCAADEDALEEIPGVGKTLAQNILKTLHPKRKTI